MKGDSQGQMLGFALLLAAVGASASHAAETGQATVTRGDTTYEFIVIQCLRDKPSAFGNAVIEFQLDGVPKATPPEIVERLLGVIEAGDNVQAELRPVVAHGPILSITRVKDGGEQVAVTDLGALMWVSDGSPMDPTSRSLQVTDDAGGARVSGSTSSDNEPLSVEANCPD